jgi:hypothetical protein
MCPEIIESGKKFSPKIESIYKSMVTRKRVGKGIFVSLEWSIFVRVKGEILDFSVVKCDLFYSRKV